MKITESQIKSIVRHTLNEVSKTSVYHKLMRKLYAIAQPWTSHSFQDEDWSNFRKFVEDLGNVDEVTSVDYWCENGGYEGHDDQFSNGMPTRKRYIIHIHTVYDEETGYDGIKGDITCHFCGTVEDPTSRYDMTMTLWINKENDI